MANLYHVDELPQPGEAVLAGAVARHLLKVLRARAGDELSLSDGRGKTVLATVLSSDRATLTVEVGAATEHQAVAPHVTLGFACPRPARADWLIEHGTEVGVAAFQPIWTDRSRPQAMRLERWAKIARAAAGQCARAHLPEVREPRELRELFTSPLPEVRLIADAGGAPTASATQPDRAILLIGPEGGFTSGERDEAIRQGFTPLRLGPHILRTETAALLGAAHLLRGAETAR